MSIATNRVMVIASLAMLWIAAFPATARAQATPDRIESWLCEFFAAPHQDRLATFPDYGMGPLKATVREKTGGGSSYFAHRFKVATESFELVYSYLTRPGRQYGFSLEIKTDERVIWPDQETARVALGRTGRVREDKALGLLVAEGAYDRDGGYFDWEAEYDTQFPQLRMEWGKTNAARQGLGFCS